MSTLPGVASKGEKGKSKFQSLDINNLYRVSLGESLEKHQQKSTLSLKHGMQSLGKVPSARRPPANLPSLKSEHSGTDTAVSLVPSNGPGWGKQENVGPSSTTNTTPGSVATAANQVTTGGAITPGGAPQQHPPQLSAHQAAIALPVTTTIPPPNKSTQQQVPLQPPPPHAVNIQQTTPISQQPQIVCPVTGSGTIPTAATTGLSTVDKSWSAVMSGTDLAHPPPYQSPQFQHEFPSLSAGDGVGAVRSAGTDTQYGPGPSLRPQTEGSWIQGGTRPSASIISQDVRTTSAPLGAPPQLLAQVGPGQPLNTAAGQYRAFIPPFMYRGNMPPPPPGAANGHGPAPPLQQAAAQRGRGRQDPQQSIDQQQQVDLSHRPIIKEEELTLMDNLGSDMGWATHDDIDYNQKLAFSDDESKSENTRKINRSNLQQPPHPLQQHNLHQEKTEHHSQEMDHKQQQLQQQQAWINQQQAAVNVGPRPPSQQQAPPSVGNRSRQNTDEDEMTAQRRRQQQEVASAVERAKQRKEEEEKRFLESKQAAAKKLLELDAKISKSKRDKENDDTLAGTINPATIPPQSIAVGIPILLPEWERDRDNRNKPIAQQQQQLDNNQCVEEKPSLTSTASTNKQHRNTPPNSTTTDTHISITSDFRQMAQIEGRNFQQHQQQPPQHQMMRKDSRGGGGGGHQQQQGDNNKDTPSFSRQFQSNLPPRFQKKQNQSTTNNSTAVQQTFPPQQQQYDNTRWVQQSTTTGPSGNNKTSPNPRKNRAGGAGGAGDDDKDRHGGGGDDERYGHNRRHDNADYHTRGGSGGHRSYTDNNSRKSSYNESSTSDYRQHQPQQDYEYKKDEEKISRQKQPSISSSGAGGAGSFENIARQNSDEWHSDSRQRDNRYDRPQRPDSRDSRTSRESRDSARHSEPRDYMVGVSTSSWAEETYEEKKKEQQQHMMRIPGPITKEKIEADDLRNEKRNLTQLKRGGIMGTGGADKKDKLSEQEQQQDAWNIRRNKDPDHNKPNTPPIVIDNNITTSDTIKEELETEEKKLDDKRSGGGASSRGRSDQTRSGGHGQQWGGGNSNNSVYNRTWGGKKEQSRGGGGGGISNRGGRGAASTHRSSNDTSWHGTESSDGSADDSKTLPHINDSAAPSTLQEAAALHRSPKPAKKFEKEDKNKDTKSHEKVNTNIKTDKSSALESGHINRRQQDNFVPRGEPSRHGRGGGGNFRGSSGGGSAAGGRGGCKRIDGYGPPSKSPFSHHQHDTKDDNPDTAHLVEDKYNKSKDDKRNIPDKANRNKPLDNNSRSQRSNKTSSDGGGSDQSDQGSRTNKTAHKVNHPSASATTGNSSTQQRRNVSGAGSGGAGTAAPSRLSGMSGGAMSDKHQQGGGGSNRLPPHRQHSASSLQHHQRTAKLLPTTTADGNNKDNTLCNAIADITLKSGEDSTTEHHHQHHHDTEGFQEVKSKKTVKERPKDDKVTNQTKTQINKSSTSGGNSITMTTLDANNKNSGNEQRANNTSGGGGTRSSGAKQPVGLSTQLSQQQIANIPSLMATPVNPPTVIPQQSNIGGVGGGSGKGNGGGGSGGGPFERPRQNKLPPRLVKQRENNRLQKAQMQQSASSGGGGGEQQYGKDVSQQAVTNAWEKPLSVTQLRGVDQQQQQQQQQDSCIMVSGLQDAVPVTIDAKSNNQLQDKTVLDGSKPLNTIIFENTNYKTSGPPTGPVPVATGAGPLRNKSISRKMEDTTVMDNSTSSTINYTKPNIADMLDNPQEIRQAVEMHMQYKEDSADMKLDFFESEMIGLTEDKSSNKNIGLARTIHAITSSNNTISPSTVDALNINIQLVKKVWEVPTVIEQHPSANQQQQQQQQVVEDSAFSASFGPADNSALDPSSFNTTGKAQDNVMDDHQHHHHQHPHHHQHHHQHEVYSPTQTQQSIASNSTTNVCKVKPTQQVAGSTTLVGGQSQGQTHQQHSVMGPTMGGMMGMGHPLSPPPIQQQYTTNQHLGYQTAASLGSSAVGGQYGMPAIPSPPTVLYNTSQQLQSSGLYGAFQIDQSQVQAAAARSQYGQYGYGLGQAVSPSLSYSAQSMYLQSTHPQQATQQAPPPPDQLYTNIGNYPRHLPATGPFQNQQLNNPTTVLISSTSNSLMSATVKPPGGGGNNQQISAIGTKAGGVGQAYQQQSQQQQQQQQGQLYMTYDPSQAAMQAATYLQNTMQRATNIQQSSSYYSGTTGSSGYFQQQPPPGTSNLQSASPMQQHQHQHAAAAAAAGYGLQTSQLFGNQAHSSAGMQNFGSHFMPNSMQLAAAMSQQYRSNLPNAATAAYMKSSQQTMEQTARSQQLKSPATQQQQQQEVLSSVFNSGQPQIPSPKSRQNCKQPPPQPSPTSQHKYMSYPNIGNQTSVQQQKYPSPIQRPINYQPGVGSSSVQNTNQSQKHRTNNSNNSRPPPRQYYGQGQGDGGSGGGGGTGGSASNQAVTSSGGGTTKSANPSTNTSNTDTTVKHNTDASVGKEETTISSGAIKD